MMVRSSEIALRRFFAGGGERKGVIGMVPLILALIALVFAGIGIGLAVWAISIGLDLLRLQERKNSGDSSNSRNDKG